MIFEAGCTTCKRWAYSIYAENASYLVFVLKGNHELPETLLETRTLPTTLLAHHIHNINTIGIPFRSSFHLIFYTTTIIFLKFSVIIQLVIWCYYTTDCMASLFWFVHFFLSGSMRFVYSIQASVEANKALL